MKEEYFTHATIRAKARDMLSAVQSLRDRHSDIGFNPGRAALLVLDMQKYFLTTSSHAYIPASQAVIPGVQKIVRAFKQANRPVVFTRHVNEADDAKMMAVWWKDLIGSGLAESQIVGLLDISGCPVVVKNQYDAFYQTDLEAYLRVQGIEQVVITGVMTHLCCETTARSAFVRGFEIIFTIDGTATYNEAFHRASLLNLSNGFALPVLLDEILDDFK